MMIQSLVLLLVLEGAWSQGTNQPACDQSSCYPATGDLLVGREDRLSASSTCGLNSRQRYCIVSHLQQQKKCFICDSRQPFYLDSVRNDMSHRIENVVSTFENRKSKWWQAENGEQSVGIQLNLEAEFHFTHLIMTFKTFRPAAMLIERSSDFGKTWKVYRYFSYDCKRYFPGVPLGPIRSITDVICESRYSSVEPSTEGEVIFRVLPPSLEIENPYSESVQDLLKMTNLRVNFTKLHTLGDNLLDSRDEIKEKYYYSIYDMVVRGSCSCYGHASRCVPVPGFEDKPGIVHGKCECTHNTKGLNCEQCEDFYNDLPWRPARGQNTNACKRCECNNHASRCHFDPAVYEATGRVSGGVCDDCRHNTMGRNCQECKPFFFLDPSRDIRDPEICQPCDCDPIGSEHGGECESHTDASAGLVAGHCICKRFVEGTRCDTCINGHWNLKTDNPDGCEACTCNTLGTVGNFGCDKVTGECRCKRYVTGRDCDQCLPNHWGLSPDIDGCKPCDCDIGGSVNENCDQRTGQCNCRANIIGRQCDKPRPGFFEPDLDYYMYEAEFARGIGNTRVVIREPVSGRPITWTGPGFMRVSEGDSLEFRVDNLASSMEYDIIIRYEPQMPERWDDVRVTVVRPGAVDQSGLCANSIPQDDFKATSLPSGSRYYVVSPSSCLEKGVSYTIKLEFNRYKSDRTTPEASVLVDSIVLMPSIDSIPIFQGPGSIRIKTEFQRYRCRELQMAVTRAELPDVCKKYLFSISAVMQEKAVDCDCDPTGAISSVCDPQGGQCQCKPNVIGRRCDQCAPGTFGFGPQGCSACNCDPRGSRDNFCDATSGQCLCIPNTYGRQCNECQRGYWNFPSCQRCECNGHADTCDNQFGGCHNCRDNTAGPHCENCARGYYGDARIGGIGCRACMCPGGAGSGYQHGDTCSADFQGNVQCDCAPGYSGARCDQCAEGHFGNPNYPGGTCRRCECNGNIDPDEVGSCDKRTGQCLRCRFNTEGGSCERCQVGFYGDATLQNCQACICNILGTNRTGGACDRRTGQCPCLPSVLGRACDRCAPNHWKIASGEGCESCNCDVFGSVSQQCNEFDGQCDCIPGRGGRTCSECEANYWGDPNQGCQPCECNMEGSETRQCDRRTGQCVCLEGVGGEKCDRCDRGTTGTLPNCVPCGECFNNWDRIINELRDETNRLIRDGENLKVTGAPSAFDKEFSEMEAKIEEIKRIISNSNVTTADIRDIENRLATIRSNLTSSSGDLNEVNQELSDTAEKVQTANNRLSSISRRVDSLKEAAEQLRKNATNIRELDVEGAFNSTKESQRLSRAAQDRVDGTQAIVRQSADTRQQVDDLIARGQDDFDMKFQENERNLNEIDRDINGIECKIVDLNDMVCDGRGDPCDSVCGGAGCGKCGGVSCDDGAVTQAGNALKIAKDANAILTDKLDKANSLLNSVQSAERDTNDAKRDAQMAYDRALEAKNQSDAARLDLEMLMERIDRFLTQEGATPAEIRLVAEEVLGMTIKMTPDQIKALAKEINETIVDRTTIDKILAATKNDIRRAQDLKDRADNAKASADEILNTAQRVIDALKEAEAAQEKAHTANDQADQDIKDAEMDLTQIESETAAAYGKSNTSLAAVRDLQGRLANLKRTYTENEINVQKAKGQADMAAELANRAETDANDLESKYLDASQQLDSKFNTTAGAKQRADTLREKANKLAQDTTYKLERLRRVQDEFSNNARTLTDVSGEIEELNSRMVLYLRDIQNAAKFHRSCS